MLLYSGVRAQQRAQELRAEAKLATGERLRALVEEVCDLVALALEPPPPPPPPPPPSTPLPPPVPALKRASRWAWVVGLAVTGAFLAWAVRGTHWSEVRAGLGAVDPVLLLAAVALATLTFPLRTIRWRVMLRSGDDRGTPFPWRPLWQAVAIGFMANNLLPARAGEFARAYVASRQLPVRFTTALASIGVERVFDALVMLALMGLAMAAASFPAHTTFLGAPLSRLAGRTAVLFGAMFIVALAIVLRPAPWLALFERVVRAVFS